MRADDGRRARGWRVLFGPAERDVWYLTILCRQLSPRDRVKTRLFVESCLLVAAEENAEAALDQELKDQKGRV